MRGIWWPISSTVLQMAPHYKTKTSLKRDYIKAPQSAAVKKQRKWIPANKFFSGSVQEGKGFAFKRKQKIQSQYNKLLRKERWRMKDSKPHLRDNYPEHLKHLYMAEQERLDEEEQEKRNRRRKGRDEEEEGEDRGENTSAAVHSVSVTEATESTETSAEGTSNDVPQSQSSQRQWKRKKMSSYQKMKQDHDRQKEERERKREEYLKDKHQREEALQKYRDKKKETYNLLKMKTKKGQPNLNLQMELLLQKIQSQRK